MGKSGASLAQNTRLHLPYCDLMTSTAMTTKMMTIPTNSRFNIDLYSGENSSRLELVNNLNPGIRFGQFNKADTAGLRSDPFDHLIRRTHFWR